MSRRRGKVHQNAKDACNPIIAERAGAGSKKRPPAALTITEPA
jgi:hypothetical protein